MGLWQDVFAQRKDVSALDTEYMLVLAVEVPEHIAQMTENSNAGFCPTFYYWNLYDVNSLLNESQPSEAAPISTAGFTEDELIMLGKSDRYLAYIRSLEGYAGKPRGHYFPIELEEQIGTFEKKHSEKVKLRQRLLGLREPRGKEFLKSTSVSIPEKLRTKVLEYGNYSCLFDGRSRPEYPIHVHHIIPQRLIRQLNLNDRLFLARENLVAVCRGCNIAKSDELSKVDVRFYLEKFSDWNHPNYPLLSSLKKIRAIQDEI